MIFEAHDSELGIVLKFANEQQAEECFSLMEDTFPVHHQRWNAKPEFYLCCAGGYYNGVEVIN